MFIYTVNRNNNKNYKISCLLKKIICKVCTLKKLQF